MHEQETASVMRWAGTLLLLAGLATLALLLGERRELRAELLLPALGALAGTALLAARGGRREAALATTEQRLRLLARATNDAIWDWDLQRDTLAWNEGLATLFGHAPEAMAHIGYWTECVHPHDRQRVVDGLARVQAPGGGEAWQDEYRFRRGNGDYADVLDRGYVIRDAHGRAVRMIGGMTDLTARRRAERHDAGQREVLTAIAARAALPDTLARIALLFEAEHPEALCSILLLDEAGARVRHGAAPSLPPAYNAAIDGLPVGAEAGSCGTAAWRNERVVVADLDTDPLWDLYRHLAHPHGLRACWSTPVRGSGGGVLATFAVYYRQPRVPTPAELRDIDDLAALTAIAVEQDGVFRKLGQAVDDLRVRNRELQDFAFVASHDLQEPLRKIQAFADRLLTRHAGQLDLQGRDYLERCAQAAARMQTLIDDLLAYSRINARTLPFAPVDLQAVAGRVLEDLEARIETSGGAVEIGALPTLEGDATQLQQLLQNLLSNALKFRSPERAPRVRVEAAPAVLDRDRPGWELRVTDNGIGFDARHAERIFAPFQRLHPRQDYEGTGIGLAIVRRIVERHRGWVHAEGREGGGAVFRVLLPETQSG